MHIYAFLLVLIGPVIALPSGGIPALPPQQQAYDLNSYQPCSISFNGHIPYDFTPESFSDPELSPFNPTFVLGEGLTWDKVIGFPDVPPSRFDNGLGARSVSVLINDASIVRTRNDNQPTYRQATLVVDSDTNTVTGNKVWHFSVRLDPTAPLDFRHEYLLAYHQSQDALAQFWALKTGTLQPNQGDNGQVLRIVGNSLDIPIKNIWKGDFTPNVWHNFGLALNYATNQLQVLYSRDSEKLQIVSSVIYNDLTGTGSTTLGETHFGIVKKPIGPHHDVQDKGRKERIILGSIFQDDPTVGFLGCVSS